MPPDGVTLRRVRSAADFGAVMGAAYASLGFPSHLPPRIFACWDSALNQGSVLCA